jgi:predicted NBD/HSP70 family sugar kinase
MKPIDQLSIRKQNILRIWDLFAARKELTRQGLAEGTGLSLMSVSTLVDQLGSLGVLSFRAPTPPLGTRRSAGRKADWISLNAQQPMWLVFDLTDAYLRFTVLALDRAVLHSATAPTGRTAEAYEQSLRGFLAEARALLATRFAGRQVLGAAIVAPGPYDIATDTVTNQRLPQLNPLHIKRLFREALGAYDYYVDEDVKFAVRAYLPYSNEHDCELLYYLYLGEGVGGAAIHRGNVMRGRNAAAGDAGQLIAPDGQRYETLLSLRGFARPMGLPADDLEAEALLLRLSQLAAKNPDAYRNALLAQADVIGHLLHAVVWMLDPTYVVVDCRYARPMEAEFLAHIDDALGQALCGAHLKRPSLLSVPPGVNSVLQGVTQVLTREWVERVVT